MVISRTHLSSSLHKGLIPQDTNHGLYQPISMIVWYSSHIQSQMQINLWVLCSCFSYTRCCDFVSAVSILVIGCLDLLPEAASNVTCNILYLTAPTLVQLLFVLIPMWNKFSGKMLVWDRVTAQQIYTVWFSCCQGNKPLECVQLFGDTICIWAAPCLFSPSLKMVHSAQWVWRFESILHWALLLKEWALLPVCDVA